jgi:hypothetical protein
MKKITLETISNLNESAIMELFYNEFLAYGKKCALYVARYHDMTIEYCADYIASGLFHLFLTRCEKLHSEAKNTGLEFSRETMLFSFLGTKKLVKKIMAMTNYSSYFKNNNYAYGDSETKYRMNAYKHSKNKYSEFRNVKRVNSHIVDIVDILEQKENRTSKKNLSLDSDMFEGVSFATSIVSYYPTPEQELLNKLSRFYSHKMAVKIRNDKKFNYFYNIATSESVQNKTEQNFLAYFKKRLGLEELKTKDILYIVSNY